MAEGEDSASKTEEPTSRKLEQARERGDVPKTIDLPQLAVFAAVAGALSFAGGLLSQRLVSFLTPFVESPHEIDLSAAGVAGLGWDLAGATAPLLLVVLGAAVIAGVLGHVLQTGFMWSPAALEFKPSKLSPIQGFQRLFGRDALIQFVKSFFKLSTVSAICFFVLRPHWQQVSQMPSVDVKYLIPISIEIVKNLSAHW